MSGAGFSKGLDPDPVVPRDWIQIQLFKRAVLKRAAPQDCDYGCGSDAESYEAQCETECNEIY